MAIESVTADPPVRQLYGEVFVAGTDGDEAESCLDWRRRLAVASLLGLTLWAFISPPTVAAMILGGWLR